MAEKSTSTRVRPGAATNAVRMSWDRVSGTLYYDPDDPAEMYVEGDKSVLGAEVLYIVLGIVLLALMAGIVH